MEGYTFRRFYLAPSPNLGDALSTLWRTALSVQLLARTHDLVHVHGEVASAITLPTLALRPSVVTLHGLHLLRRLDGLPHSAARTNLRLILRAASKTICVAESERNAVLVEVPGAGSRLEVIHNGIAAVPAVDERERARAREVLGVSAEMTAAAWVGSLDERKDPLVAVEAAMAVARTGQPFVLLLAGDGPLRTRLDELGATSLGAVRVLGYQRDIRQVLAAADIFVLSSHREGLPYALLEAMALRVPAIVTEVDANVETIGDAGIVVPRSDVDALAAAMLELVVDEAKRVELGDSALRRVESRFRIDEMVERTRQVYELAVRKAPHQA